MTHFRIAVCSGLLATLLGMNAHAATPAVSGSSTITAKLIGASEVPAVTTNASGTVEAKLDKQTNVLSWTVTYSGLSGAATAGHFHGPAAAGTNAGVAVPLTGSLTSPIKGMATITPMQAAELMAGMWYLNLHTAAHPDGEIRGQVIVQR